MKNKPYKQYCKMCGKYYEGRGKYFCSNKCRYNGCRRENLSEETLKKMSEIKSGKHHSKETKKKLSLSKVGKNHPMYGKKHSIETRIRQGKSQKGKKHHNWQGGITKENHKIRNSIEIKLWREATFKRDNWTCQKCNIKSGCGHKIYLNSHHVKNFSEFKELRTSIENGITFCKKCHKKFHKKYGIKNNNQEQLEEFINNK